MSAAKSQLLNELAEESVNVLRIRKLCRDNPGLIESAGLRIRIWSLLLLGSLNNEESKTVSIEEIKSATTPCDEQHVLEADVRRTRADIDEFRSASWRKSLTDILQNFCLKHNIQYKQGMNEVVAPFLFILPPPKELFLPFALFEAFLFRYLERYFCLDDSSYLFKSFRLFHILLAYHDPQLALHLHDRGFPPEFYAPQWFLTLYSRSLQLQHVLRLWDMMIAVDDPAFNFFIGLSLLRKKRDSLLKSEMENIPEILSKLSLGGVEDVDDMVSEALPAYKQTPRGFCRHLRLSCVSSTDLSPSITNTNRLNIKQKSTNTATNTAISQQQQQHSTKQSPGKHRNNKNIKNQSLRCDVSMAMQSARRCVMLTARELVDSYACELTQSPQDGNENTNRLCDEQGFFNPQQFVLIDTRSSDEISQSGAGTLPRAIHLEPSFLNNADLFDAWLQHFDGTRGCHICIVDTPPPGASREGALWRRLLYGQGDGRACPPREGEGGGLIGGRYQQAAFSRDSESQFLEEENAAVTEDLQRTATQLAELLQRNGFPYVTVLEGGFPALVEQLMSLRGGVEPVIINHDQDLWLRFLKRNGYQLDKEKQSPATVTTPGDPANIYEDSKSTPVKRYSDYSVLDVTSMAYRAASRLGHHNMEALLLERINAIHPFDRLVPPKEDTSVAAASI